MKTFYIYLTDVFCGELNYSYVTKFKVNANTERGAVCKVSRCTGLSFRHQYQEVWYSTSKLTGLIIEDIEYLSYSYDNAHEL